MLGPSDIPRVIRHSAAIFREMGRVRRVEDITAMTFREMGAEAVILDHDGVLGSVKSLLPDESGIRLINEAISAVGVGKVFILSNTLTRRETRAAAYNQSMPDVVYLKTKRKPDPEGLLEASKMCGVPVEKIAVVDDGVLTGALMSVENGAITVYALRKELRESLWGKFERLFITWTQIAILVCCRPLAIFL